MDNKLRVTILPEGRVIWGETGKRLMGVLADNGYRLVNTCGGRGVCGKCKVVLNSGRLKLDDKVVGPEDVGNNGSVLSCQAYLIDEPVEITVPLASRVTAPKIIAIDNDEFLELLKDKELLPLDEDHTPGGYAIVGDIGTTTVAVALVPLRENIGYDDIYTSTSLNWQLIRGSNIIARIEAASDEAGLRKLQELVVSTVNDLIAILLARTQIKRDSIRYAFFSGNSVMLHILLGIDPYSIGQGPDYRLVKPIFQAIPASNINLDIDGDARIFASPCVHGFLGGDIVADLMVCDMHNSEELSLLLDLGSNGEMVLGSKDGLYATSCAMGPAFEGQGILHGLHAQNGAIESVFITPRTLEPKLGVIGNVEPVGICGTGLIEAISQMYRRGIIDRRGTINRDIKSPYMGPADDVSFGYEYILWQDEHGNKVSITEKDIHTIMLSKAPFMAGIMVLLKAAGEELSHIQKIYIAGGFGQFLDVRAAANIGLLPALYNEEGQIAEEKYAFMGNGSLKGSILMSLNNDYLDTARELATRGITYFDVLDFEQGQLFEECWQQELALPAFATPEGSEIVRLEESLKAFRGPTRGGQYRRLTEQDMTIVHNASLSLLWEPGINVGSPQARQTFLKAGAHLRSKLHEDIETQHTGKLPEGTVIEQLPTDSPESGRYDYIASLPDGAQKLIKDGRHLNDIFERGGARIRIPGELAEAVLKNPVSRIVMGAQDPQEVVILDAERNPGKGLRDVHFAPGGEATEIWDANLGGVREPANIDLVEFATLADALDEFACFNCTVEARVDEALKDFAKLFLFLNWTKKHTMLAGLRDIQHLPKMIEIAELVAGGKEALAENPLISFIACLPVSPLSLVEDTTEKFMAIVRDGRLPVAISSAPQAGLTCPIDELGELIQVNTEVLSALILGKLVNPEAPILYRAVPLTTTNVASWANMVNYALNTAATQMAQDFYGVPCYSTAGVVDIEDREQIDIPRMIPHLLQSLIYGILAGPAYMHGALYSTAKTFGSSQILYILCNTLMRLAKKRIRENPERLIEFINAASPKPEVTQATVDDAIITIREAIASGVKSINIFSKRGIQAQEIFQWRYEHLYPALLEHSCFQFPAGFSLQEFKAISRSKIASAEESLPGDIKERIFQIIPELRILCQEAREEVTRKAELLRRSEGTLSVADKEIPEFVVVGDRINPARQSRVQEAIIERDEEYMLDYARRQIEAGAWWLDISVSGIEKGKGNALEDLPWLAQTIQRELSAPIAIDSDNPKVIKAVLDICDPDIPVMINSINADNIGSLLSVVDNYAHLDLSVIVITEISESTSYSDSRIESIKPLVKALLQAGIHGEKIYLDPAVSALGASQTVNNGCETLATIAKIKKDEFFEGMHITGGFSNVSFGMPDRPLINRTFVAMAIALGADSGLINPLEGRNRRAYQQLMQTIKAAMLIYANREVLFAWAKTTNILPSDRDLLPLVRALDDGSGWKSRGLRSKGPHSSLGEQLSLIKKTLIPMLMVWEAMKENGGKIRLKSELEPYVGYDIELGKVVAISKAILGSVEDIRDYVRLESGASVKEEEIERDREGRMEGSLGEIQEAIIEGREEGVAESITKVLEEEGRTSEEVIECIGGAMQVVGDRYKRGKYFVTHMIAAAIVSSAIIDVLEPYLTHSIEGRERIIIATVEGDMHDIGKNIVSIMLKGAGFEVIDLGVNVDADTIVETAIKEEARIICLSALLDTTRDRMYDTIQLLQKRGLNDKIKVLAGGASVSREFADQIGASYGEDAFTALEMAKQLL